MNPPSNNDQLQKQLDTLLGTIERDMHIRVLMAFQCIYCGGIVDNPTIAVQHSIHCTKPQWTNEDETKE